MTWVKLDDGFPDHPKVVGLTDRAFRVHVRAMCYCGRFSPGIGFIPTTSLRSLGGTAGVVKELIAAGLWDDTVTGLYVHDFPKYHPKVDHEAKAEAGRQGGLASGEARRIKQEAEMKQGASSLVEPNRTPVPDPSRPVPSASLSVKTDGGRSRSAFVPLSQEERDSLKEKWGTKVPDFEEQVSLALAHEAHKKYPTGQKLYVNNWLARAAGYQEEHSGRNNGNPKGGIGAPSPFAAYR